MSKTFNLKKFIFILFILPTLCACGGGGGDGSSSNSDSPGLGGVPVDAMEVHKPDDEIDYYWLTYLPGSLSKSSMNYIVVEGSAGVQTNDYQESVDEAKRQFNNPLPTSMRTNGFIYLRPVFPHPKADETASINDYSRYPQGLYYGSFVTENEFKKRPDLKLNKMLDRYIADLRADGYNISDKVFMFGFSISGAFAIHYAAVHPERVQAIAPGSPRFMAIPAATYNGTEVNWPVGIADLFDISGKQFNFDQFKQIPMFLFIGEEDETTPVPGYNSGPPFWTPSGETFLSTQANFIHDEFGISESALGKDQVDIMEASAEYYSSLGIPIELEIYSGLGHTQFDSRITEDVTDFFLDNR